MIRIRPLGFDVEWRPTFQKGGATNPIALVQLADEHRVLLLHISLMGRQGVHRHFRSIHPKPHLMKYDSTLSLEANS